MTLTDGTESNPHNGLSGWIDDPDWDGNAEPQQQRDEPPLGELHEDDWAFLLSYKTDEWLELKCHEVRQGRTPREVDALARRQATFAFVQRMYNEGIPPEKWTGRMTLDAYRYMDLNKHLTEDQKEYLQEVASGKIHVHFPDPSDEAEEHRGKPRQWSY